MVGVPRSTGCRLCVKRRVRCDEGRPACHNCVRYGAECPGYARPLKFVAGKHNVKRDSAGTAAAATTASRPQSASPPAQILPGSKTAITPLVEDLISKRNEVEMSHFLPLFHGLPGRIGAKFTLDSAVFAFAAHLRGKETGDGAVLESARASYVKSLSALQAALNHPVEWKSSETLCSAMLLCLYEVHTPAALTVLPSDHLRLTEAKNRQSFAGTTSPDSWMRHASGVGKLMQARGAEAHNNEWDTSMVLAFRGLMVGILVLVTYTLHAPPTGSDPHVSHFPRSYTPSFRYRSVSSPGASGAMF